MFCEFANLPQAVLFLVVSTHRRAVVYTRGAQGPTSLKRDREQGTGELDLSIDPAGRREKMKEHLLLVWYLAMGASVPMAGCARTGWSPTDNRRQLLMQGQTKTAADEWEASTSRQGILEIETEAESEREGPHPLRTADWKLEVSCFFANVTRSTPTCEECSLHVYVCRFGAPTRCTALQNSCLRSNSDPIT